MLWWFPITFISVFQHRYSSMLQFFSIMKKKPIYRCFDVTREVTWSPYVWLLTILRFWYIRLCIVRTHAVTVTCMYYWWIYGEGFQKTEMKLVSRFLFYVIEKIKSVSVKIDYSLDVHAYICFADGRICRVAIRYTCTRITAILVIPS